MKEALTWQRSPTPTCDTAPELLAAGCRNYGNARTLRLGSAVPVNNLLGGGEAAPELHAEVLVEQARLRAQLIG